MSKDQLESTRLLNAADLLRNSFNDGVETEKKQIPRSRWIPTCWYIDCLPCVKARFVLSFMVFLGLCNVYALRVNLSVAIVPMTSKNPSNNQRWVDLYSYIAIASYLQYIYTAGIYSVAKAIMQSSFC